MSLNNQSISLKNDSFTELEIFSQPDLWLKLHQEYSLIKYQLRNYLNNFFNNADTRVILTGAGSSAFIGEVLLGIYNTKFNNPVSAVATTDLVTHPELYFNKQNKYLLVSFARSGNSPESSQAIVLADELSHNVSHLIITCKDKSELIETASVRAFPMSSPTYAAPAGVQR